ncbi:MAG: hypothetical protein MUW56_15725 [Chryseobacterium sp.]|uniref:hypothetical protein n=1 Tax=Chryseobacterium sp. TaxID=1871047 RepID=UPI0025BCF7DE|nr:hypothetical protein [Chryseobacterium sp.]MCJ7935026.1 hypothetical protein [Chryseobacterium sp.]
MKRILNLLLFLTVCLATIACSTNYYTVLLTDDTKLYSSTDSIHTVTIIPKNTHVFLSSNPHKNNYREMKWENYSGWAYKPAFTSYSSYGPAQTSSSLSTYRPGSTDKSSGGTASVKSYYRKDGTYVRSHTRSTSSRRR